MNSSFIYKCIDRIKNILIDFDELKKHQFILNELSYYLNYSDHELIYKNNNYYIEKIKNPKKRYMWYGLYQKMYYFSEIKILFPLTNFGIFINNNKKILYLYNINTFENNIFLRTLLLKKVIFVTCSNRISWNISNKVEFIEISTDIVI